MKTYKPSFTVQAIQFDGTNEDEVREFLDKGKPPEFESYLFKRDDIFGYYDHDYDLRIFEAGDYLIKEDNLSFHHSEEIFKDNYTETLGEE